MLMEEVHQQEVMLEEEQQSLVLGFSKSQIFLSIQVLQYSKIIEQFQMHLRIFPMLLQMFPMPLL